MPANTRQSNPVGSQVNTGTHTSVITLNETNQLKAMAGKIGQVVVWNAGTTWQLDVYDHASANTNPVWSWVSADGKGVFALQMPLQAGLRVVTSGTTPGAVSIVWA